MWILYRTNDGGKNLVNTDFMSNIEMVRDEQRQALMICVAYPNSAQPSGLSMIVVFDGRDDYNTVTIYNRLINSLKTGVTFFEIQRSTWKPQAQGEEPRQGNFPEPEVE